LEDVLQRLFSTFAEGWPGAGLLLQRVLASTVLLYLCASHGFETAQFAPNLPQVMAAAAGIFLLLGLWTPIAGITIATVETWIFFASFGHSLTTIILAGLGMTVAMIGPGIWSVDARLYGRKHLDVPRQ
jgi:putative oxidoreductase